MKKLLVFLFLFIAVICEFCTSSKKATKTPPPPPKMTYQTNVQSIVMASCSPCHTGANARQKSLNTYDQVKANIDDIITRIQRNPNDRGFMPKNHPKLPDSTIQVFVQWKNNGLAER